MSNNKQKLELTWIGKNNPEYDIANIEPRILEENPELSNTVNDPNTENMIIHGDNLLALKALLPEYEGKIKCIYIDPPYNTGNAFEHYDDSVEHSIWLSLMKPRLELLKILLADDGVIFVHIDDSEGSYLKVLIDEVFGRENSEITIFVQVRYAGKTLAEKNNYQKLVEQIHCYKKTEKFSPIKKEVDYSIDKFEWRIITNEPDKVIELKGRKVEVYLESNYTIEKIPASTTALKETWATGTVIKNNASGKFFDEYLSTRVTEDGLKVLYKVEGIGEDGLGYRYFTGPKKATATKGKFYSGVPTVRLDEMNNGGATKEISIENFWDLSDAFGNCRLEGGVGFRGGKKPERLIERILSHSAKTGDLVLDSFLGSGTTAAVAHKMGLKYIGIEMGEQAYTHCKVRLDNVINGSDVSGISETKNWKGGGGYKFYELAPSFIVKDEFGNPVIDDFYNDAKLIKVMCKLMNFTYKPSQTEYWKHGTGQGKNYLYVTTQLLTSGMVQQIAQHLTTGESLIICPKKFEPGADKIDNRITIKKIPQSVLKACHFGKKEYLLPIKETAMEEVETEDESEDSE